jgi:hypothetical protein
MYLPQDGRKGKGWNAASSSSQPVLFSYNPPVIDDIWVPLVNGQPSLPTSGGVVVTISGRNLGGSPGRVLMDRLLAMQPNGTRILLPQQQRLQLEPFNVTLPDGNVTLVDRCASVALEESRHQEVDVALGLTLPPTTVATAGTVMATTTTTTATAISGDATAGDASGNTTVGNATTVAGQDSSRGKSSPTMVSNSRSSSASNCLRNGWSHDQVRAVLSGGVGAQLSLWMEVDGRASAPVSVSFNKPSVVSVSSSKPDAMGEVITIRATDLGQDPQQVLRIAVFIPEKALLFVVAFTIDAKKVV